MSDECVATSECDGCCEAQPMMGRSWWKRVGYNTPCVCAKVDWDIKQLMEERKYKKTFESEYPFPELLSLDKKEEKKQQRRHYRENAKRKKEMMEVNYLIFEEIDA